jgi:uncharacterized lipoprotein YmbA
MMKLLALVVALWLTNCQSTQPTGVVARVSVERNSANG